MCQESDVKICSSCSARNPSENKFCGQCGTRLAEPVTTTADTNVTPLLHQAPEPTEGSQSPQPSNQTQLFALPAWLNEDESARSGTTNVVTTSEQTRSTSGELPDWLCSYGEGQPKQDQPATSSSAEQPSENEVLAEPTSHASPSHDTVDLPDWLRAMTEGEEGMDSSNAAQAISSGETTALQNNSHQAVIEPASISSAPLPAWLREDADTTDEQLDAEPANAPATQLPSWLQDETRTTSLADITKNQPVTEAAVQLPSWLQDDQPNIENIHATESAVASTQELPPWLRDDTPVAHDEAAVQTSGSETDLPAWLRDDMLAADEGSSGAVSPEDQPLPAWLVENITVSDSQPDTISSSVTEEPPAWLVKDMPVADETPTVAQTSTGNDAIPPWLLIDTATDRAPATQATANGADTAPEIQVEESVSDHGTTEVRSVANDTNLPSWLLDDTPETAEVPHSQPSSAVTQILPVWLLDETTDTNRPSVSSDHGNSTAESSNDLVLPPWLDEIEATAASKQPSSGGSNLPAWLLADEQDSSAWNAARSEQADSQPSYQTEQIPVQAAADSSDNALPAWLWADDETSGSKLTYPATGEAASTTDSELPSWLVESIDASQGPNAGHESPRRSG
jgi:hypothetical protein